MCHFSVDFERWQTEIWPSWRSRGIVIEKVTGKVDFKRSVGFDEEMNIPVKESSINKKLCLNAILGPEKREIKEKLVTWVGRTS